MCEHGKSIDLLVPIPAALSHTGELRWDMKPIDSCLADLVSALNAAGVLTAQCCCGHGRGPACIDLHDGRVLRVFGGAVLPWEQPSIGRYPWMVIRKCDGETPIEVLPFERYEDAVELYERLRMNWTDVFLVSVLAGPRDQGFMPGAPRASELAEAAVAWVNSEEGQAKLREAGEQAQASIETLREARKIDPKSFDDPFTI